MWGPSKTVFDYLGSNWQFWGKGTVQKSFEVQLTEQFLAAMSSSSSDNVTPFVRPSVRPSGPFF